MEECESNMTTKQDCKLKPNGLSSISRLRDTGKAREMFGFKVLTFSSMVPKHGHAGTNSTGTENIHKNNKQCHLAEFSAMRYCKILLRMGIKSLAY